MTIAELTAKMIAYSEGDLHDIAHYLKVWAYARTIGQLEGLDGETQFILEAAALVHDIACPLCRAKYGNANGKLQEREGAALAAAFLKDTDLTEAQIRRISDLVGRHHTYTGVDGPDCRILLEADYLANAEEKHEPPENIRGAREVIFRTKTGTALLNAVYGE